MNSEEANTPVESTTGPSSPMHKKFSPWRLAVILLISIFTGEFVIMQIIIGEMHVNNWLYSSLLDSILLTMIVYPCVYFLMLRPMRNYAGTQMQLVGKLEYYQTHLEAIIKERTIELSRSNKKLHDEIAERMQASSDLQNSYELQRLLNELLRLSLADISLNEQLEQSLTIILSSSFAKLEAMGGIFLMEDGKLRLKASKNLKTEILSRCAEVNLGQCLCGKAAASGEVQFADCVDSRHDISFESMTPHGHYCVPIMSKGKPLGVLVLYLKEGHRRDSKEEGFLHAVTSALAGIIERQMAKDALCATNQRLGSALKELQETQQHLLHQERLKVLGQMASGIAHDINNSLCAVTGFADILLRDPKLPQTYKADLENVRDAGRNIAMTVGRLKSFYRTTSGKENYGPVDLNNLITHVVTLTKPRWENMAIQSGVVIQIKTVLQPDFPVLLMIEPEIRDALINMIINSADAMPKGGVITIKTSSSSSMAVLEVSDNGVGMDEETRQRCLEPFYSTKGERGTGLGLAMVATFVKNHEGLLDIESQPNCGTTIRLSFPAEKLKIKNSVRVDNTLPPDKSLKVLCLDDDAGILSLLQAMLSADHHKPVPISSSERVMEMLDRGEMDFDVALVDLAMPHIDGRRIIPLIRSKAPQIKIVVLTGAFLQEGEIKDADYVLNKPIILNDLRNAFRKIMA